MKTIAEYFAEKPGLIHPGRSKGSATKAERASKRRKMKLYWLYKNTTFDSCPNKQTEELI